MKANVNILMLYSKINDNMNKFSYRNFEFILKIVRHERQDLLSRPKNSILICILIIKI